MLTLILDGDEARHGIADCREAFGAERFHEMAQAGLLNAPDNPWRVNHVRVADLDLEVTSRFSGLSDWVTANINDQADIALAFWVLPVAPRGERPSFRLRRIVGSWLDGSGNTIFDGPVRLSGRAQRRVRSESAFRGRSSPAPE